MPRKNRRQWWKQYLALIGKGESPHSARQITGIPQHEINRALATYPHFKEGFDRAVTRGAIASARKVSGRGRGAPRIELTPPLRRALLDAYSETGSSLLASALCGLSRAGVNALRSRDPAFNAAWLDARQVADFCASELGLWRDRELALYAALYRGASLADAAREAGVTEALASLLAARHGMTEQQARRQARGRFRATDHSANRFTVPPQGEHPREVRSAGSIQHLASQAEREAIAESRAIAADQKRMTPEQVRLFSLIDDESLTPAQAAAQVGITERELGLWAESNAYIRFRIID